MAILNRYGDTAKNLGKSRNQSFFEPELTEKLTDGGGMANSLSTKDIIYNLLTQRICTNTWHTFNAAKKSAYGYYGSGLASGFNVYIGEYRKAADSTAKAALEPTEFTTTVTSDESTPIEGATVAYRLTGSTVERYKGTTDSNGEASGALRADGGKSYDLYVTVDGYETYFEEGLAPAPATKTITMTTV